MRRDGSIGLGNMGSDGDPKGSHFSVMKIKAKCKCVEARMGDTEEKIVNPIIAFEFCGQGQRGGQARAVVWGQGEGPPLDYFPVVKSTRHSKK